MTEKKENVQRDKNIDPKEREKLESVRKADAAVKTMQDFTSPEVLYQELITSVRKYHPSTDITMIQKAYEVASDAHKDQKRKSGEPYIIHPLCVAIILADLELDKETIVAGLLHDAVEDTWMTTEEVEKEFANIAERYGLEVEKVKEIFADEETENIKSDIAAQKALDLITDAAVEVPVTEVEATVEDAE